jgi:hypothetical protein
MSRWLIRGMSMVLMVGLPAGALFTGASRLVPFLAMPLVVLGGPMILGLRRNSGNGPEAGTEDDSDSDNGGGGNRRPDRGPTTPSGPTGLLPLTDSTPSTWRLRGNGPQHVSDPGHRRQPHQPSRIPRRVPTGPHR